jgi:Lrp/AsnC family transcriptional regulator, regulator for asnA, asnC and gidA
MTGVSETTVKRRIEALFAKGVITTAVFPNPRRLGYETQAIVGLEVDAKQLDQITTTLRKMDEVAFVSVTLGRYDVVIYLVVPSMEELVQIVTRKIAVIPGINGTETIVSASVTKAFANWRIPLDALDPDASDQDEDRDPDERIAF